MAPKGLPDKPYYRIGEVAEYLGVEPHVLRYWEREFPQIKPRRAPSRHRIFLPQDIRLLETIKRLLHEEGYTVAGARRRLAQAASPPDAEAEARQTPAELELVAELRDILKLLD